ncbi:flagellar motor switch protein FliM [uncultured Sphingomonas sp.]|uniref:flagellar motor switch protein FliM n=1 Tax=uncultured Sphingomonas sp. TaxID=158754 RepID=UPI0025DBA752|nr:flagellar motor switch protein FliM [uncultured Sphingomonas sp.]
MVNTPDPLDAGSESGTPIGTAAALGGGTGAPAKLHPFGDLHTLQHLSARAARGVRQAFEGYWRAETRAWAEPLEVLRAADYRAARGDKLTAYLPLSMDGRPAVCVLDSQFVVEVIDLFFGGTGDVSPVLALEFTPACDVIVARIAKAMARALEIAWEPLARARFAAEPCELGGSMIPGVEADEVVIATRFAIARGSAKPAFVDVLYPVATLKPHTVALTGKVVAKPSEVDAEWRTQLTRAAMGVRFPVRSVLAEPTISLSRLMDLKEGDVIPISFGADVPVVIGGVALGLGTVGTSNGRAAIRISKFEGPLQ